MNILVLNCGSSSLKYQLINMEDESVIAKGLVERIGIDGSILTHKPTGKDKYVVETPMKDHNIAVKLVLDALMDAEHGVIKSTDEIAAVGHRVLHAGEKYIESCLVTEDVKKVVRECFDLGPLHNPANLIGIEAVEAAMPGKPNVAVWDTAFGGTMEPKAYLYAIPREYYEKYGVRRYGFHGTSHRYVSRRACEILGVPYEEQKIITAHVGNGGSIAAVDHGKCVDTSMGLTPVEGLLMGTRCGDVDAGALSFIMEKEGLDGHGLSELINKKSGVAGLVGGSSDMRDLEAAVEAGDERATMVLDVYNYRIKKYIGAYAAALGGVDIILFTGGVGENQANCRSEVCEGLEFMGVKIDLEKNKVRGEEAIISADDSKVTVAVIPTDEELMIASDTLAILNK